MVFSYDYNESLGYLTGLTSRLLSNTLATRFKAAGIDMTAEQWGAIVVLLNCDGMTQGQLGERLCLEKSSVSRLLDGLERRDWIVRIRDPKDSRQKFVTPTPKVVEAAECCAAIARKILIDAQHGMTVEEQLTCQSFLSRIIANLNEKGR